MKKYRKIILILFLIFIFTVSFEVERVFSAEDKEQNGFVAPDTRSEEFWASAAARYKNQPHVLFGIYNEPFNISWDVWKNGGVVTDYDETDDAFSMH